MAEGEALVAKELTLALFDRIARQPRFKELCADVMFPSGKSANNLYEVHLTPIEARAALEALSSRTPQGASSSTHALMRTAVPSPPANVL